MPVYQKAFETVYLKQIKSTEEHIKDVLHVSLPKITSDKRWLLIRSDKCISHLIFSKTKYTINSSDLIRLSQLSVDNRKTIIFSSNFRESYAAENFAMYFVPNHQNMFFVGPFVKAEWPSLGIKALIFKNDSSTKLQKVNLFTVQKNWKESLGCWMKQIHFQIPINISGSDAIEIIPKFGPVIDLTSNESDEDPVEEETKKPAARSVSRRSDKLKRRAGTDDDSPHLNAKKSKKDEDEGEVAILKESKLDKARIRYMITNIPKLGYIEAYQFPDSKIIDVRWPIGKHIQRFSKPSNAIQMLER